MSDFYKSFISQFISYLEMTWVVQNLVMIYGGYLKLVT